jgi:outer membrane protein assembly factor BamB
MSKLFQTLAAHRWATALAALVFAAAVVVAGLLYLESKQSELTVGPGAGEAGAPEPAEPKPSTFVWPTFGYDRERTHSLASSLKPPFKSVWKVRPTGELLEFPPSLAGGRLYVVENEGRVFGLSTRTGRKLWKRDLGKLAASTPAYQDERLYVTIMCLTQCAASIGSSKSEGKGRVAALDARTGRVLWSRDLPSRTESSPLVVHGRVYFGTENGTVYALRTANGRIDWTYQASDAVKSALAYHDGRLYFGDYAGSVNALRARDGKLAWTRTNVSPENFYGTPAVGFGRVFLSTTDGKVHALRLNGNVAWRFSAGPQGYIYASPALAKPRGLGPTVYIGAHDSRFYALDARSGRVRWSKGTKGAISGSATVVGDYVYFSALHGRTTYGVRARDGKEVFRRRQGAFNPAIADERRLYLIGYSTITALDPQSERAEDGDEAGGRGEQPGTDPRSARRRDRGGRSG